MKNKQSSEIPHEKDITEDKIEDNFNFNENTENELDLIIQDTTDDPKDEYIDELNDTINSNSMELLINKNNDVLDSVNPQDLY